MSNSTLVNITDMERSNGSTQQNVDDIHSTTTVDIINLTLINSQVRAN